jgi:hypothetical protein
MTVMLLAMGFWWWARVLTHAVIFLRIPYRMKNLSENNHSNTNHPKDKQRKLITQRCWDQRKHSR